ncbi:MAG: thiol:disulfide interchange protein DsbA/DsbL [Acidihalobacter sp.]|uniref:thiol:disulfide interchange protein DsbA/DsbL n=1 Tax=Acidihalobacter sp. TaxID=1872108 RepID=UPI00307F0669
MRLLSRLLAGLLLLVPLAAAARSGPPYDEGFDFQRITPPPSLPTNAPRGKVQVAEFFWYDCPHCAHIEPELERWRAADLPKNAEFVRIPAVLGPRWEFMARVYYAARLLGVAKRMTPLIFRAVHDQHRDLGSMQAMMNFFAAHGVSAVRFRNAVQSLEVDTQVREARLRTQEYGVQGVPTLVIGGRYRVTADMTGSYARMFKVAAWLAGRSVGQAAGAKSR